MNLWGGVKSNAGKIGGFFGGGLGGATLGHFAKDVPYQQKQAQAGWDPYGGMPGYPGYQTAYNQQADSVAGDYAAAARAGTPSEAGLNKYRQEAMRSGPSAWAQMTGKNIGMQAAAAREKGAKDIAGQQATAAGQLAMRGGLQSGARERMAKGAAKGMLDMQQDIARQEMGNRLQAGINDEQNRISQLGALPGMDVSMAGAKRQAALTGVQGREADINRRLEEQARLNAYNMAKYQADIGMWAAGKQADATMRTQPKGLFGGSGFLGLGLF